MGKESTQFIRAKLVNYTEADCSHEEVANNRVHYHLRFEKAIGWTWVYSQVQKLNGELTANLELWKIRPSGMQDFEIDIREIERRADIDDNQSGLADFEQG